MNSSVEALRATFGSAIGRAIESCGDTIVYIDPAKLPEVMRWLRDTPEQHYDYLVDVTAVEYRDRERPLEVVYNLRSLARRTDLRIKVELDPQGDLTLDSVVALWRGADWLEREVYDMFGVRYANHPNLKRILLPEDWVGYPLRKDYNIRLQDVEWVRKHLGIDSGQKYYVGEARHEDTDYITPSG